MIENRNTLDLCSGPMLAEPARVELTVTRWSLADGPQVVTRPWGTSVHCNTHNTAFIPRTDDPTEQVIVIVDQVCPAQPGWLAGRMRLEDGGGFPFGMDRPVNFFAEPNDVGSHVYFDDPRDGGVRWSVQIRTR